jgi:pyrrolidone-carboxylate peptidase
VPRGGFNRAFPYNGLTVIQKGNVYKLTGNISNSAGLYVCNSTYYHALSEIFDNELPTKAVFVHLPKLSNDFTIELLVKSIKKIIEEILKQ